MTRRGVCNVLRKKVVKKEESLTAKALLGKSDNMPFRDWKY